MNQIRVGQKPVEFLIEDVQVNLCGAHHPVDHGLGLKSYPTILKERKRMIINFLHYHTRDK